METKAVATFENAPASMRLVEYDAALKFAKIVATSTLCPDSYRFDGYGQNKRQRDAEQVARDVFVAVQLGHEVGLTPMQSIQNIAVINGRPTLWGKVLIGLVKRADVCEYVREWIEGEGDEMIAYCESKRKDEPHPHTSSFSVRDAKLAGLWGKTGPWKQYPKRMLQMRARGFNLSDNFADVLGGLWMREDVQDYADAADVAVTDSEPSTLADKLAAKADALDDTIDDAVVLDEVDEASDALDALYERCVAKNLTIDNGGFGAFVKLTNTGDVEYDAATDAEIDKSTRMFDLIEKASSADRPWRNFVQFCEAHEHKLTGEITIYQAINAYKDAHAKELQDA